MSEQLLQQLLHEVKDMKSNMSTKQDIEILDKKLNQLSEEVSVVQDDVTNIKKSINRIEKDEPEDIIAMLHNINKKLDEKDSDTIALNKRLFNVESKLERIANQ